MRRSFLWFRVRPSTVLGFPFVEGRVADAVLAAHLNRFRPCLLLPQDRDNLLLAEPAALNRPSPLSVVGLYSNLEAFQGLTSARTMVCRFRHLREEHKKGEPLTAALGKSVATL